MITIIGPTASGKTALAAELAYRINSEIISADSRQVYRGMDLGTGKDLADYEVRGTQISYHLIDICPAGSRYNLHDYQQDCHVVLADLHKRGIEMPILCGGTGLYVESILRGYNLPDAPENGALRDSMIGKTLPELMNILAGYGVRNLKELDSAQRAIRAIEIEEYKRTYGESAGAPKYSSVPSSIICLSVDRDVRRQRITERLHQRLDTGMVDEVRGLLFQGVKPEDLIYYGLEYKWLTLYLIGEIDYGTMVRSLEIAIHQFAKRQMTWFRGMERRGLKLHYIDALLPMERKVNLVIDIVYNRL